MTRGLAIRRTRAESAFRAGGEGAGGQATANRMLMEGATLAERWSEPSVICPARTAGAVEGAAEVLRTWAAQPAADATEARLTPP
ncbi:hypothetical protein GCM10027162_62540 [Streptomyces incanus]